MEVPETIRLQRLKLYGPGSDKSSFIHIKGGHIVAPLSKQFIRHWSQPPLYSSDFTSRIQKPIFRNSLYAYTGNPLTNMTPVSHCTPKTLVKQMSYNAHYHVMLEGIWRMQMALATISACWDRSVPSTSPKLHYSLSNSLQLLQWPMYFGLVFFDLLHIQRGSDTLPPLCPMSSPQWVSSYHS